MAPCAKLMMRTTPKMTLRPTAIRPYAPPRISPCRMDKNKLFITYFLSSVITASIQFAERCKGRMAGTGMPKG